MCSFTYPWLHVHLPALATCHLSTMTTSSLTQHGHMATYPPCVQSLNHGNVYTHTNITTLLYPTMAICLSTYPPSTMCSQVLLASTSPSLRSLLPSTGWSRAEQWPAPGRLWAATVEGPGHQCHGSGGGAAHHAWRKEATSDFGGSNCLSG